MGYPWLAIFAIIYGVSVLPEGEEFLIVFDGFALSYLYQDFEYYCVKPAIKLRQMIWGQIQLLDAEYRQYEPDIRYEILAD